MTTFSGNRANWGTWFAVGLLLLAGLLVADVAVADLGRSSISIGAERDIGTTRMVAVAPIQAQEGDVVHLFLTSDFGAPFSGYTMYAVEGGQGDAFLQDRRPTHVYEQHAITPGDHAAREVFVERPTPPSGSTAPGELDLVYVFTYSADGRPPAEDTARDYYERWANAQAGRIIPTPEVADAASVAFHSVVVVSLYVLVPAIAATEILWTRNALRLPSSAEGPATAGMSLIHVGSRALRFLRALLFGVALPLVYVGWLTLFFFWNIAPASPGPGPDWTGPLRFGVGFILLAVAAGWALSLYTVLRAGRRWRQHEALASTAV